MKIVITSDILFWENEALSIKLLFYLRHIRVSFFLFFFSLRLAFCLRFSNYRLCPVNAFFSSLCFKFVRLFFRVCLREQPMPFSHDVLAFDLLIGSLRSCFFWFTGIVWKTELTNWICSFSLCALWMMWFFNLMGKMKPNERTNEEIILWLAVGVWIFFHSFHENMAFYLYIKTCIIFW